MQLIDQVLWEKELGEFLEDAADEQAKFNQPPPAEPPPEPSPEPEPEPEPEPAAAPAWYPPIAVLVLVALAVMGLCGAGLAVGWYVV